MNKYAVGAGLLVASGWWASRNRVTVTNESGQTLLFLTVRVCGETSRFEDVPPGAAVSVTFGTPRDEDYVFVEGLLEDGTEFRDNGSYVVWEDFGRRFSLVIRPEGEVVETMSRP